MDLREIAAAYQSIYLKEEVEDTILLEDLSQDEVDDLVEEIIDEFLEEGFSLEQIEEGFEDYISEESEVLNEAKKRKSFMASQREKLAAQRAQKKDEGSSAAAASAARAAKVEADKAAKVVRPSEKIAASAKKAVAKRKDATGTTSGAGAQGTVRSKGGSMGAEGKKGTALPPSKKGGAMIKRDTKSVSGMETGPKAEVKAGVRKAMTYRGVGSGKKVEVAGAGRKKMSDVVASAERKAASPKEKVKRAAKETVRKTKSSVKSAGQGAKDAVKSAGQGAKDAVKSGVKKARNFVGSALSKLADKVKTEGVELDSFDTVIAYLIDEEIASDFTEATAMMSKLSAETISEIHESQMTYITEISAQLAHTASMKADEVRRKAALAGDRETAAKKAAQASRIYKGVGPRRAKERKEGN